MKIKMKAKNKYKWLTMIGAIGLIVPVTAVTATVTACGSQSTTYTIFHTNDVHGRLQYSEEKYNSWIGLDKLAYYVNNNDHDLLLDAGDLVQGLPMSNYDHGKTATDLANYMGYDYKTIGNHEFDWGLDTLMELKEQSSTESNPNSNYLADNIVLKNDVEGIGKAGDYLFDKYAITSLSDGTEVGIIGVATPETVNKTNPPNVSDVEFLDPIESTQSAVDELTQQGIDIIIVLSHLGLSGYSNDSFSEVGNSEYTSGRLAEEVDGIDLIIDGHSHTKLENGLEIKKENQPNSTWIAQTECYTQYLGKIEFQLSSNKTALTNVNIQLLPTSDFVDAEVDSTANEIIQPLEEEYNDYAGQTVFEAKYTLRATEDEVSTAATRLEETNLGDMFADSLIWEATNQMANSETIENKQVDFGIINGGTFRSDIEAGDVTYNDVLTVAPFGNTLEVLEVTGEQVEQIFDISLQNYGSGGFLQVSNSVVVTYNLDNEEVTSLTIDGQEIDESATYQIATNDYLKNGGDNYDLLTEAKVIFEGGTGVEEIFADYAKQLDSGLIVGGITMDWESYKDPYPGIRIIFEE